MIIMKKIYFTLLAAMALTLGACSAAMTLIFQILSQRQRLPQVQKPEPEPRSQFARLG